MLHSLQDLLVLMRDEDARRRGLFRESASRRVGGAKSRLGAQSRRAPPGAHIGFELAFASTQEAVCCGACGSWLGKTQDIVPAHRQHLTISLEDSEDAVCIETQNVLHGKPYQVRDAAGGWVCSMRSVRCSKCKVFLGVHANELTEDGGNDESAT